MLLFHGRREDGRRGLHVHGRQPRGDFGAKRLLRDSLRTAVGGAVRGQPQAPRHALAVHGGAAAQGLGDGRHGWRPEEGDEAPAARTQLAPVARLRRAQRARQVRGRELFARRRRARGDARWLHVALQRQGPHGLARLLHGRKVQRLPRAPRPDPREALGAAGEGGRAHAGAFATASSSSTASRAATPSPPRRTTPTWR